MVYSTSPCKKKIFFIIYLYVFPLRPVRHSFHETDDGGVHSNHSRHRNKSGVYFISRGGLSFLIGSYSTT